MDINFQLFDPCYGDSASLPNKSCVYLVVLRAGCTMPYYNNVVPKFSTYEFSGEKLKVLFVGKSKKSLRSNDYNKMFTAGTFRSSTLRKSIGLLLGYSLSLSNGRNQEYFDKGDENRISEWMNDNLWLLHCADIENIDAVEKELVETYNPPLNITGNKNETNKDFRENLSEQLNPREKDEDEEEKSEKTDENISKTKRKAHIDSNGMIVCPKCNTHLLVSPDVADDEQTRCSNCGTIFKNPIIPLRRKRERLKRQREKEERANDPLRRFFRHLFYAITIFVLFGFGYAALMKCDISDIKVDGTTMYVITEDYIASPNASAAIQSEERMKKAARGDYSSMDEGFVDYGTPVHLFRGDIVVIVDVNHKYGYKVIRLSDYQEAIVESPKYLKKLE